MPRKKRHIATVFQIWLLVTVLIALSLSAIFTATVQSKIGEAETKAIIETSIADVSKDIAEAATGERNIVDMDDYVGDITKNRHIGIAGFVAVCNSDFIIVTDGLPNKGKSITSIGLNVNLTDMKAGDIFEVTVRDVKSLCTYQYIDGYYIIGLIPIAEAMYMNNISIRISLIMTLVVFAILFVLVYFLVKRLVLDNLVRVNSKLSEITGGNLEVTVDVRSNEEFASLSDDINSTVETLKGYIAEAAARIDKELEFAKQVQYSSLPTALKKRDEFDLYADMHTAKEVGGDFYDYYMLGDSQLAFLVADVSGKGIPAAMFMMRAKTTIKDLAERGLAPDEIFTIANEKLCENNEASMFVTAWMGILDLKTGILKFANAGHNPPLLCRKGATYEYFKIRSGMALAAMEGIKYRKNQIELSPGDRLYLYTDGVTEATDVQNQLYGEERLLNFINGINGLNSADKNISLNTLDTEKEVNPQELCAAVRNSVDEFAADIPQFDDITMLALIFNAAIGENSIKVVPGTKSRKAVDSFTEGIISKLEVLPKISGRLNVIMDEIYSNIMYYSGATLLEISYHIEMDKLEIVFKDNGREYNPLSASEPDISLGALEREVGGLGIFMVKKMASDINYIHEDEKNILTVGISLL